jgi:sarcosine oxidase subunit gamma
MLNYQSSIKEEKSYSGLSIKEISPVMKLNLRGKNRDFLSTIGKNINMILPVETNTSSSSDKYTSLWLSPDEWMVFSNNTIDKENNNYEIEELLFNKISKTNLVVI